MHFTIQGFRCGFRVAVAILICGLSSAVAQNLIADPSFETPVVGPGGFQSGFQAFTVGQTISGVWTVVGSSANNVGVYPNTETVCSPPTALNVQQGSQAMDLTGSLDNGAAIGVSQSFATTPGSQYSLSFYVGQLNNQTTATTQVTLNGTLFQTAANTLPTSANCITSWQLFTYTFTATSSTTTLGFINASPAGVSLNGLDAVSVTSLTPPATPAPSALVLALIGMAGLTGALLFKRYRLT
jgi:hypothetical protein